MSFINEKFMLKNKTAEKIYEKIKDLPIIDYHCHLDPKMIAEDYRFKSAYDVFLGGDHYKWRQMRSNGIPEEYITGAADDFEKWKKWAETMPLLIGNPLYHWTHLELKRYFDVDETLRPETAKEIWDECNKKLGEKDFSAKGLIERSNVEVICTTDDPKEDLRYHKELSGFSTKVLPTFRPDKLVEIERETFVPYVNEVGIKDFDGVLSFLTERIEYFNSVGCRLSDHALDTVPYSTSDARKAFEKRMAGGALTSDEADGYRTALIAHCAREYEKRGWTMQFHIGAMRNNNKKMYRALGADTGFDSVNDVLIAEKLSALLSKIETDCSLPKTILYNLNPKDNYVLGTMIGNFQSETVPGKLQFGSGWWFNDNYDGMVAQMKALANLGLFGRFVGMLTDSRSFLSYTRHEYFRRILSSLIGEWVEGGEYPDDEKAIFDIAAKISYYNAKEYFRF